MIPKVKADVSIPRFYENFDVEHNRMSNAEIQEQPKLVLAGLN